MATVNPFDLLGDDDNDDPSHLIAVQQQKLAAAAAKKAAAPPPTAAAAKLPSKPLPPAQAVRENRGYTDRGGGFGRGRGRVSFQNQEFDGFSGGARAEEGDGGREADRGGYSAPRGAFRGGRRGGYNGDVGGGGGGEFERPARRGYGENSGSDRPARREYERHSGTDRGYGMKREGAGRGNWGATGDDGLAQEIADSVKVDEKIGSPEKNVEHVDAPAVDAAKEGKINEPEERDEDKEMTLEEYEKVREEKRKALLAMKTEERKVDFDKEFESMQQLSVKKENSDVFIKLGSDKEGKKKESADRDERAKKSVSIQQFLKPAEGERYYSPGARGRGRGRGGDRAPFRGGFGGGANPIPAVAPPIEDPGHFPTLGGK